ncbi:MAG: DUF134 domain-containing protein [Candidatus Nanoarchaeia archaeon]|jgi:predicted DNA-binding protein (UPF0251 family)
MPRPRMIRRVRFNPDVTYYKPAGVPMRLLEEVIIKIDEAEALRLCDVEGLKQDEAAKRMGVSQSTLFRMLSSGREKLASAIIKGKAIKIQIKGDGNK